MMHSKQQKDDKAEVDESQSENTHDETAQTLSATKHTLALRKIVQQQARKFVGQILFVSLFT